MNFNIEYKKKIDTMINCYINSSENWDLLLSKELDEFKKNEICIWGAGNTGKYIFNYLKNENIEVKCFCDSDFLKYGKNIYRDTICLSKEEIKKYNNELLIIVAIEDSDALVESLKNDGFEKIYNFKKIEWMKLKAKFEKFILENDIEDLKEKIYKLIDICEDEQSKKICLQVIENWFLGYNKTIDYTKSQYFVSDIIKKDKNEVFIDVGAFDGDTIKTFLEFYKNEFSEIHAFEIDDYNYKLLLNSVDNFDYETKKKIFTYNLGICDYNGTISYESNNIATLISSNGAEHTNVVTLDSQLLGKKITFIKMDIEGFEIKALRGASNLITKNKPKLAICIYHKFEDLWEIPFYIKQLNAEYKIYIRHHSFNLYETVCYAII